MRKRGLTALGFKGILFTRNIHVDGEAGILHSSAAHPSPRWLSSVGRSLIAPEMWRQVSPAVKVVFTLAEVVPEA